MSVNLEGFTRKRTNIELGGITWLFSELSLADFAKFRTWLLDKRKKYNAEKRRQIIEEAKQIGEIDPLKLLEHLDKPLTDEEMELEMETFEGVGYMAYLSLKYKFPEITLEDALQIISVDKIPEITEAMIGSIGKDKKKPKPREKKNSNGQQL